MVKLPDLSPHAVRHEQLAPSTRCPGRLWITGQRRSKGEAVRDEWTCQRCGGNNLGAWKNRRTAELTVGRMVQETRNVKLKLCVHRKSGAPGYGSDGAGAEVELDLDDDLAGEPAKLVAFAQIWYGSIERAVDDQLARMAAKHPQPTAAAKPDVPGPWVDRNGRPTRQAPPEGLEEYGYDQAERGEPRNGSSNGYADGPPSRRNGSGVGGPNGSGPNGGPPRNDPPKNGKQLIGWANGHGKYDDLMRLAKAWNLGKIIEWTPDDVAGAFHELSRPVTAGWGGRS